MSLTLKIGSLFIRTLAKPIANYIKRNAREHEQFRRVAVNFAQRLHRIDMRLRLGLLQDPAVIERQIAREVAEAEAKRAAAKPKVPTVKTEAQTKADEEFAKKKRKEIEQHVKAPPKIRPLSESKAIETGATFISETFLFLVAGGAIVYENWRSRRKESSRRDEVKDRLESLEREKEEMRLQIEQLSALTEKLAELEAADTREGSGHRRQKSSSASTNPTENSFKQPASRQHAVPSTTTAATEAQSSPPQLSSQALPQTTPSSPSKSVTNSWRTRWISNGEERPTS